MYDYIWWQKINLCSRTTYCITLLVYQLFSFSHLLLFRTLLFGRISRLPVTSFCSYHISSSSSQISILQVIKYLFLFSLLQTTHYNYSITHFINRQEQTCQLCSLQSPLQGKANGRFLKPGSHQGLLTHFFLLSWGNQFLKLDWLSIQDCTWDFKV